MIINRMLVPILCLLAGLATGAVIGNAFSHKQENGTVTIKYNNNNFDNWLKEDVSSYSILATYPHINASERVKIDEHNLSQILFLRAAPASARW